MKISFILFILLSISVLSVAQWEERKNGLPNSFSGSIDAPSALPHVCAPPGIRTGPETG